jgi:hypothetical protein
MLPKRDFHIFPKDLNVRFAMSLPPHKYALPLYCCSYRKLKWATAFGWSHWRIVHTKFREHQLSVSKFEVTHARTHAHTHTQHDNLDTLLLFSLFSKGYKVMDDTKFKVLV